VRSDLSPVVPTTPTNVPNNDTHLKFKLCPTSRKVIKQAQERAAQTGENPTLAEHAALIRRLGKRMITDLIEIGRRLTLSKPIVPHGNEAGGEGWEAWLKREFGWSPDTALNFMRVYELSQDYNSRNFRDLSITPSALYFLARRSTPEAVRTEMIERANAGENITVADVRSAIPSGRTRRSSRANPANPTNDWRGSIQRGFNNALALTNNCVEFGTQARADISPELKQQMREVLKPHRRAAAEAKAKAQGLVDYFAFIESILNEQVEPNTVIDGEPVEQVERRAA
jgi:hypothetical protein